MPYDHRPGGWPFGNEESYRNEESTYLPNLIQRLIYEYTAGVAGKRRTEVNWKGLAPKDKFIGCQGDIRARGWDIIEMTETQADKLELYSERGARRTF